jgi:hypothetical protein
MAEDSLLWPTEQDAIEEQVKYEQKQASYNLAPSVGMSTRQRNAAGPR